jgi:P pilus assembly chaperone PapD
MTAFPLRSGALLLAAALCVPGDRAHAQLTVDALELFVTTPDSTDVVRTVRVRNDGSVRIQAEVLTEDWERDEVGTNRFLPLGSHARSCREALTVFPGTVALEPGEAATLRVRVAGGAPACWGVVFLAHRTTMANEGRQLSYTVRTGVKVYVEPVRAVRDGAIEAMTLRTDAVDSSAASDGAITPSETTLRTATGPALDVVFRNLGQAQLTVRGTLEVRRDDDTSAWREEMPAFPVLPEARRRVTVSLPALPPGRYVILALLDFGGAELVAGQLEYEVR